MQKSIDSFIYFVAKDLEFSGVENHRIARYVFASKNKKLESVIAECSNDSKVELNKNIYVFAQNYNISVHKLINKHNDNSQYKKDREERYKFEKDIKDRIIKKSLEEKIPIAKIQFSKHIKKRSWFTKSFLDLKNLDQISSTKECLKWINIVAECCCGEPLFQKTQNKNNELLQQSSDLQTNTSTETSLEQNQEEYIIQNLWKQGFLKCDLNR